MDSINLKAYLTKGLMLTCGLVVFGLALIGSFYLVIAAIVVFLSASLMSRVGLKPHAVKASNYQQPLDAEYRVVRHK